MQDTFRALLDEIQRAWPFRWAGWVLAVAIAGITTVVTLLMPDMYTSSAQIAVLRSGDAALVPIHNAEIRFLNDATLDNVLNAVDLGMDLSTPAARQKAKDTLRRHISLEGTDTELFVIKCTDKKPARAKQVCDLLLLAFKDAVEQNSDTSSLKQQLINQQQTLGQAEKRLQEYRIAHLDVFGQGGIEARLDAARAVEEKAAADYDAAVRRRDQLQAFWRTSLTSEADTAPSSTTPPAGDPLIDRLYAAYTELEGLRVRFSESHPDVVLARRQIETIVRQYPPSIRMCGRDGSNGPSAVPSSPEGLDAPVTRPLVDAVAGNIAVCRALTTLVQAERDVDSLGALNQSAPPIEAELSRLTAERDAARDRTENIRRRIQELDLGDPASLYTVIAPPEAARAPSSPNRPLLLAIALLGSLAGGGGYAFVRGLMVSSFVSASEVRRAYTLPFYGAVSQAGGLRSKFDRSAQTFSFLIAVGALVGAMLVLILADPLISIARGWVTGVATSVIQLTGMIQ